MLKQLRIMQHRPLYCNLCSHLERCRRPDIENSRKTSRKTAVGVPGQVPEKNSRQNSRNTRHLFRVFFRLFFSVGHPALDGRRDCNPCKLIRQLPSVSVLRRCLMWFLKGFQKGSQKGLLEVDFQEGAQNGLPSGPEETS